MRALVCLSYCLHYWPYLGGYDMVVVNECHDFGGYDIYLVGSRCFVYEKSCDVLCGMLLLFFVVSLPSRYRSIMF